MSWRKLTWGTSLQDYWGNHNASMQMSGLFSAHFLSLLLLKRAGRSDVLGVIKEVRYSPMGYIKIHIPFIKNMDWTRLISMSQSTLKSPMNVTLSTASTDNVHLDFRSTGGDVWGLCTADQRLLAAIVGASSQ